MKIKFFVKKSVLSILILTFTFFGFFAGCNMSGSADVTVTSAVASLSGEGNTLYGSLADYSKEIRTITAGATDKTNLKYYIYGVNSANGTFPITKVDVNPSTGEFSVNLYPTYWNVTVFALPLDAEELSDTSKVYSNAVLIGHAAADLTYSSVNAKFTLSVNNLTTAAHANFNVVLSNDNGDTFWQWPTDEAGSPLVAVASIKNIVSGETLLCNNMEKSSTEKTIGFLEDVSGKVSAVYNAYYDLTPGTYSFEINIYDSTRTALKGVWADTIVLGAGQTISGDVYMPNVLGTKPLAPASFYASYYKNSEDLTDNEGTYKLKFNWANTPNNESHYEIQLSEFETSAEWEGLSSWGDPYHVGNMKYTHIYDRSYAAKTEYFSGSMNSNNTELVVYAKLGVQYQARIRSVNTFGSSDWVNVTIAKKGDVTDTMNELSYFGEDCGDGSKPSNMIHRGRITYDLKDGTYEFAEYYRTSAPRIQYYTQFSPDVTKTCEVAYWSGCGFDGNESAVAGSALNYEDKSVSPSEIKVFQYWNSRFELGETGRIYDKQAASHDGYKSFKNIKLYAEYVTNTITPVPVAKTYKLLTNWIEYQVSGSGFTKVVSELDTTEYKRSLLRIPASAGTLNFALEVPVDVLPGTYETIAIEIYDSANKAIYTEDAFYSPTGGCSFAPINFASKKITAGVYEISFTGKKSASGTSLYEKCYITMIVE